MNDAALRKALADFVQLGNALDAEAKRRYGPSAFLFHEADGSVVLMAGDADGRQAATAERADYIREQAAGIARWGCGAL
jgi:hypothetical protein